jgi:hypothetical protein
MVLAKSAVIHVVKSQTALSDAMVKLHATAGGMGVGIALFFELATAHAIADGICAGVAPGSGQALNRSSPCRSNPSR